MQTMQNPSKRPPRLRRPALALATVALAAAGLTAGLTAGAPAAAAQSASATTPRSAAPSAAASLRPGDLVRINVWTRPDLSGEFSIAEDGRIQHPIYQQIVVTGIPAEAVKERVGQLLTRDYERPEFVVEPLVRVAVGGQVRQPTVHVVPLGKTVSDVIMLSGGVTEVGRMERVRLVRDGHERMLDLTSSDLAAATIRVQSGDQIIVMRRRNVFFDVIMPVSSVIAGLGSIAVLLTQR